jgi:hypothetical protein
MWPEHVADKWNLVTLPTKAHYVAHYLLYKSFSDRSCVFAFNQMRRVCDKPSFNCQLYQAARVDLAHHISLINTGRSVNDQERKIRSERFKGTNVYRHNTTGELQRFTVDQEPEGWIPFQTGRVRTIESKLNMASKMSNRIWQYNPETHDVKFSHDIHEGYTIGYPEWLVNNQDALKDHKWINNIITGESVRIPNHSEIPEGFKLGRGKFNNVGFKNINNSSQMKVVNLSTKTFQLINKSDYDPCLHMQAGQGLDSVVVYEYKNKVFTQYTQLLAVNPELPQFKSRSIKIRDQKIPKPHFNQTPTRREFCEKHQGKTPEQVGLLVIPLLLFNYQKGKIYVKS